ncbi:MAG: hypothetical protein WC426_13090 [Sulfuriferula sp.]
MKLKFLLLVASSLLSLPACSQETINSTLCNTENEIVVFSCSMANRDHNKTVSICASAKQGEPNSYIEYRFGTAKKIELTYSVTPNNKETHSLYRGYAHNEDIGKIDAYVYFGFENIGYFYEIENYGMTVFRNKKGVAMNNNKNDIYYRDILYGLSCDTPAIGEKSFQSNLFTEVDGKMLRVGKIHK